MSGVDANLLRQVDSVRDHLQAALNGPDPDAGKIRGFEDELVKLNDALIASKYDGGTQAWDAHELLAKFDHDGADMGAVHGDLQTALNDINELHDKVQGQIDRGSEPPRAVKSEPAERSEPAEQPQARVAPDVPAQSSAPSDVDADADRTPPPSPVAGSSAPSAASPRSRGTGGGSSGTGSSSGGFANEVGSAFGGNGAAQGGALAAALDHMSRSLGIGSSNPTMLGSIIQSLGNIAGAAGGGSGSPMGMFGSFFKAFSNGDLGNMLRVGDVRKAGQLPARLTPQEQMMARRNAAKFINSVDWSKGKIGLWVPGTGSHDLNPEWAASLGPGVSSAALDYPADVDMPKGVAMAMYSAQIVLREAQRRGAKVAVGGYSQGAWAADNIAAMRPFQNVIASTVVFGEPIQSNARRANIARLHRHSHADDAYANTVNPAALLNMNLNNPGAHGNYNFAEDGAWQRSMWGR